MGSEEFRLGIHNFLTKFSFKNAVTNDLFDELSAVSSQNLDIAKARKIGTCRVFSIAVLVVFPYLVMVL